MRLQEKSEQHGVVPYILEETAVPEDWILLEGGIGEGGRQTVDKRATYLVQDLFLGFIIAVKGCPGNTGTADSSVMVIFSKGFWLMSWIRAVWRHSLVTLLASLLDRFFIRSPFLALGTRLQKTYILYRHEKETLTAPSYDVTVVTVSWTTQMYHSVL